MVHLGSEKFVHCKVISSVQDMGFGERLGYRVHVLYRERGFHIQEIHSVDVEVVFLVRLVSRLRSIMLRKQESGLRLFQFVVDLLGGGVHPSLLLLDSGFERQLFLHLVKSSLLIVLDLLSYPDKALAFVSSEVPRHLLNIKVHAFAFIFSELT